MNENKLPSILCNSFSQADSYIGVLVSALLVG
jgi:hypothetical protein